MVQYVGYIWPVRKEWGKKTFERTTSHIEYAYGRNRSPKQGDILVFYNDWRLIGSMPVDEDGREITPKDTETHKEWARDWRFIMGLDGTQKIEFKPPLHVTKIADSVEFFGRKLARGKNLHSVCWCAPRITKEDYESILSLVGVVSVGYPAKAHVVKAIKEIGKKRIARDELLVKLEQIMKEEKIEPEKDWRNVLICLLCAEKRGLREKFPPNNGLLQH